MLAVDDGFVAEVGFGVDHEVDLLALCVVGSLLAEVAVNTAAGDDAVTFGIDIDVDNIGFTDIDTAVLLTKRHKEILGETPIQK